MPDSIFDLKQSLFTSNLPVPTSRDRGSDKGPNFDHVLDSAQRQSRDDHRAHDSHQTTATDNKQTDDKDQVEDAPSDNQDEVTLSNTGTETAATETVTSAKVVATAEVAATAEAEAIEETKEPTADEIAAAVVAPLEPIKPVLKQLPKDKGEHAEQQRGIELNDAIQPGGKRGRVKPTGQESTAVNKASNSDPVQVEEVAAPPGDAPAVDPNVVVVATELQATELSTAKVASANKNERAAANKSEQSKPTSTIKSKTAFDDETNTSTGEHAEGAFAVTVTPESEDTASAPKRRLETSRQTMPEVNEGELKLASSFAVNAATATTAALVSPDAATETPGKPAETPSISATSSTPTETPAAANHLRGQQLPGSFANRLEAASAERKANDGLNGVDRTRFVQRVARAFQRAGETEGEIRLRLSPPELGAVKLEVSLRDGAMTARLETETTTARNLLMDNLPQLKEKLAEQNIRIETFEVEVRDQSNHSSAEDAKEQLRQQNEQQRNRLRGERATSPVVAAPIVQTLSAARQSSQLNIVI